MKRALSAIAALLFVFSIVQSQDLENSLLWKISGNDLESPSYLYGTFHLLCPDDLAFSELTEQALKISEQLALELDFDDPGLMGALQAGMFLKDGATAKDYLTEDEYTLVAEFFSTNLGMPFEALASIKPFFLSSMTMLFFLDCQPGSPEQEFANRAGELGMEVIGLETVEEQLAFVDNISLEDAAKMLVEGIEDQDEGQEMTSKMVTTYLAGDLEGIEDIIESYMDDEYAEFNEDLLIKRNLKWLPKFEELMREKSTFIAVGAGHLTGEQGMIKLLRKAGYKLEAVK